MCIGGGEEGDVCGCGCALGVVRREMCVGVGVHWGW